MNEHPIFSDHPGRRRKKAEKGSPNEPVILRVRMKRRELEAIRTIADFDKRLMGGDWDMSAAVRDVLRPWIQAGKERIRLYQEAHFSGAAGEAAALPTLPLEGEIVFQEQRSRARG